MRTARAVFKVTRIALEIWAQAIIDMAILNAVHAAARSLRGRR